MDQQDQMDQKPKPNSPETQPEKPAAPTPAEPTPATPAAAKPAAPEPTTKPKTPAATPAAPAAAPPPAGVPPRPAAPARPGATVPVQKPIGEWPETPASQGLDAPEPPPSPEPPMAPRTEEPETPPEPVPPQDTPGVIVLRAATASEPAQVTLLSDDDLFFYNEGTHYRIYEKLGAHMIQVGGVQGTYFAVWAPNAESVSLIGDFNDWTPNQHYLRPRGSSGIWEVFLPDAGKGTLYKYHIISRHGNYTAQKTDPMGFYQEVPPKTASIVWNLDYTWNDQEWMQKRKVNNALDKPISIYELHLGSWMRNPDEGDRYLTYRELAHRLADYITHMGFTHVEFLPIMEHPFSGSWGYQTTGYFAPTSRHGSPQDFMYMVDVLHQHDIGVILDWVPSHFPSDGHALGYFDGTHLYEHFYPQKGWHPDWSSYIFNYGRHEVRAFLISSALYWLDKYHIDGLRVDAVASMLYLDYSRKQGEWMPNEYGGNENIEAIWFLRNFNEEIYRNFPDVQTIAEESTSWSMVSRPTYVGGLGFGMKWDMGWMHDTLRYMSKEPIHRKYHHNDLTFRMLYAWHENFCLPLSHDEVVHGKGSLIDKMPGDMWQQNANLRALFGYMYAQPGKKLIFMGGEFGQWSEWVHDKSLDWHLLQWSDHQGMQRWMEDLNKFYRAEPAMHELDCDPAGFEWIDVNNWEASIIALLRKAKSSNSAVVVAANFTPVPRHNYRLGVPYPGEWREAVNSDGKEYAGSGVGNSGGVVADMAQWHGRPYSINITLPPLGIVFFHNPGPPMEEPATATEAGDAATGTSTTTPGASAAAADTATS